MNATQCARGVVLTVCAALYVNASMRLASEWLGAGMGLPADAASRDGRRELLRLASSVAAVAESLLAGAVLLGARSLRFPTGLVVLLLLFSAALLVGKAAGWPMEACGCLGPNRAIQFGHHLLLNGALASALAWSVGVLYRPHAGPTTHRRRRAHRMQGEG